jgi:hypothetical protein
VGFELRAATSTAEPKQVSLPEGNQMRMFLAALVALSVLYFWDRDYNNGQLLAGLESLWRAISHSMFH